MKLATFRIFDTIACASQFLNIIMNSESQIISGLKSNGENCKIKGIVPLKILALVEKLNTMSLCSGIPP